MYCPECGVKANGKFCWSCGHALPVVESQAVVPYEPIRPVVTQDWAKTLDCQTLIAIPEVRDRIAACAARAKKKFSGEDFLECCDKFMTPLTGGVPFTLIAKIAQPISERLGLKTGKARRESLAQQPGAVLVAVLCSMAQNGQRIRNINQSPASCTLEASLPSDIWSFKGDLRVTVSSEHQGTTVEADITIPGQVYDWGKSKRALHQLFADMLQLAKAA